MSRLKANIIANIAGQGWFVLLSLLCTPFLIKLLGVEAYGLIAFYALLQNFMQILDLGMGPTLNREVARSWSPSSGGNSGEFAAFVVTMERWYWILGSTVGLALFFLAPYVVATWLRPDQLSSEELTQSARLISLLACLQWPLGFYQNGLLGMQRQVALIAFQVVFGTMSTVGGVLFVWLGPRSIAGLLTWQVTVMLLQLCALAGYFWFRIALPKNKLHVDPKSLRGKWGFSLGMSGIAVTGLVLTHLDKVVLSRLLTLEYFGYYTLAGTLARGLYVLITPVFNAYFPRFSNLASDDDKAKIRISYHGAAQVMSTLILPVAAIIALFSEQIALLWLHNSQVARSVAPIATLLVIGTCLNGLMNIPFALQLANGYTKIGFYINCGLVVVLVPAILFFTIRYGAIGGAAMWAAVNGLYLIVGVPVTHKYLLSGEAARWFKSDVLPPLVLSVVVVGMGRLLMPAEMSFVQQFCALTALWVVATIGAACSVSHVRNFLREMLTQRVWKKS